jgi:Predicted membrane protein
VVLAATGDTWGISGPTFLLAYLVVAAVVWVAGIRARRALADPRDARFTGDLTTRPHDVAYLNGGAELAVFSALSALHLRGAITSSRGTVQAVGRLDPGTDELERAIHFTAAGAVHRRRLPFHRPVETALAAAQQRLVAAGLLLSEEQRRQIKQVGVWMLAVAGLGLVRLLVGIAEAKSVGFLVVAMLGVITVAVAQLVRAPRRTKLGDRTLAVLREEHHALAPEMAPDWTVYGPAGAALGIGVFGTGALWAADPAFADELAAQRVTAGGSSDGGSYYGGGGDGGGSSDGGGGGGGCGGRRLRGLRCRPVRCAPASASAGARRSPAGSPAFRHRRSAKSSPSRSLPQFRLEGWRSCGSEEWRWCRTGSASHSAAPSRWRPRGSRTWRPAPTRWGRRW